MDNTITIKLDDKKETERHTIFFDSAPTLSELIAATLVLEEVIEHNFDKEQILQTKAQIYPRLKDIEEVGVFWNDKS